LIMAERIRGSTAASIARQLGRPRSTITRELARNESAAEYDATQAGTAYRLRRERSVRRHRLIEGEPLYRHVRDRLLYWHWSPQQIAARLRYMHPDEPQWQVSHETIYAAIYARPKGALRQDLIAALRQAHPRRGTRRRTAARGGALKVPEALTIKQRPEEIAERLVPGHWEGDFIKGAFNRSAVGTLVERKTRFVVLCKISVIPPISLIGP
jgi:IS30 family transposase